MAKLGSEKKCEVCGESFVGRKSQVFCSNKCRASSKKSFKCIECKKDFLASYSKSLLCRKCSLLKCTRKSNEKRSLLLSGKPKKIKTCVICGVSFTSKNTRHKTCSKQCLVKNNSIKQRERFKIIPISRSCVLCGDVFLTTINNRKKTCSKTCKNKNKSEKRTCMVCEKTFSLHSSRQVCCSEVCRKILRNKKAKKVREINSIGKEFLPKEHKICVVCGEEFFNKRGETCSEHCSHRKFSIGLPKKTCLYCGIEFTLNSYGAKGIFCSLQCSNDSNLALDYGRKQAKLNPLRVTCGNCGELFLRDNFGGRGKGSDKRFFCSKTCLKLKTLEEKKLDRAKNIKKKICEVCSNEFESFNPNTKACSAECRKVITHNYKLQRRKREKEEREKVNSEKPRTCVICNGNFLRTHSVQKTCSEECAKKMRKETNRRNNELGRIRRKSTLLTKSRNPDKLPLN